MHLMVTEEDSMKKLSSIIAFTLCIALNSAYAEQTKVNWKQITLDKASGVPNEKVHKYGLTGIIRVSVGPSKGFKAGYTTWAKISGRWDQGKKQAKESMVFKGDINGSLVVTFNCLYDPWIHNTNCVYISSHFAAKGKSKVHANWNAVYRKLLRPLSIGAVSLSRATQLSKNNSAPPPPPPPAKKKKKLVKAKMGNHLLKVTPDITVAGVGHTIVTKCKRNSRNVKIRVGIKNVSGKLFKNPSHKFLVKVEDLSAKHRLKTVVIPGGNISPHSTVWLESTMAYYGLPKNLAGSTHNLRVTVNPLKIGGEIKYSNNTRIYGFKFPGNFCKLIKIKRIK